MVLTVEVRRSILAPTPSHVIHLGRDPSFMLALLQQVTGLDRVYSVCVMAGCSVAVWPPSGQRCYPVTDETPVVRLPSRAL